MALNSIPGSNRQYPFSKDHFENIAASASNSDSPLKTPYYENLFSKEEDLSNEKEDNDVITFTRKTFHLSDGKYNFRIVNSRLFTNKAGSKKWLLELKDTSECIHFVTTFPMPLDTSTAFGKCVYSLSKDTPRLTPDMLEGHNVSFQIKNSYSKNGTQFSNIVEFEFLD